MRLIPLLCAVVLGAAVNGPAFAEREGYPTHEVVRYVQECMAKREGQSWGELYNCSCKFDVIAAELDHDEFVAFDTAKRGESLAGERGGVLRETEFAEDLREDLDELDRRAERRCFAPVDE